MADIGPSAVMPTAGAPTGELGTRLVADGWPSPTTMNGNRLQSAQQKPGNIRHDLLVEKAHVGKLIGRGGNTFKELEAKSGAEVFICDEAPPGHSDLQRLVALCGNPAQVTKALYDITMIMTGTSVNAHLYSEEPLPPLDPNSPFQPHASGFPPIAYEVASRPVGQNIRAQQQKPGAVRHDILIRKSDVKHIIGKGAATYDKIKESSGAYVYVLDQDAPPGEAPDLRLIVIVGLPPQVSMAVAEVSRIIEDAKKKGGFGPVVGSKRAYDGSDHGGSTDYAAMQMASAAYTAQARAQAQAQQAVMPPAFAAPQMPQIASQVVNPFGSGGTNLHGLENPAVLAAAATAYNAGVTPEALQLYAQHLHLLSGTLPSAASTPFQ